MDEIHKFVSDIEKKLTTNKEKELADSLSLTLRDECHE